MPSYHAVLYIHGSKGYESGTGMQKNDKDSFGNDIQANGVNLHIDNDIVRKRNVRSVFSIALYLLFLFSYA